jgi:hypothetical protein
MRLGEGSRLKLLTVEDGVFLDEQMMEDYCKMVTDAGWQLLIESIDPTGKVGIELLDGAIIAETSPSEAATVERRQRRRRPAAATVQGGLEV